MALRAFRIGSLTIGIRVNTAELDAAVTACLGGVSVDDPGVLPNYAIRSDEDGVHGRPPRYRVYIGCKHATTTRTLDRAVGVLCGYLEHHLPITAPVATRQLELVAVAFVRASEAVLAPWQLRHGSPTIEARLEREGIRVLEQRLVRVDVDSMDVIVGPPRIPSTAPNGDLELTDRWERVPPGQYRLRGWLMWKGWRWQQATAGIATAYGMTIARRGNDVQATLQAVATLVAGLPRFEVYTEADVTSMIRSLLS